MENIEEKVTALREDLRNGRRSYQAGEGPERHGESANGQAGSGIQIVGRNNATTKRNRSSSSGDERSTQEESERVRPRRRRSGNNGSSAPDGDQPGERDPRGSVGPAIERIDDVPERIDNELPVPPEKPIGRFREDYSRTERNGKYAYYLLADRSQVISPEQFKALPSQKDVKSSSQPNGISEGLKKVSDFLPGSKSSVLSASEAKELLEPLASALQDYGGYIDKFLQFRTQDPTMPDIWGDLTELEAQVLARLMIRRGQKSPAAADVVRSMVHGDDYIQASIIVVPRVMRTVEATRKIPRKPKIVRVQ